MFLHKYIHIYLHYNKKKQNIQIEQGKKNNHHYRRYSKVFSLILVSLLTLKSWLRNAQ